MKLIVIAPNGKMGKLITRSASEIKDIKIIAGVAPRGRSYIGEDIGITAAVGRVLNAPVVDDIESVIEQCDSIIDFSTVESSLNVLSAAVSHKKAYVCGTTGFSAEQFKLFEEASALIPVLYAANTSKLVNVMYKLVEIAAKSIGNDTDIEVLDMHDKWKVDAPSGTANEIGNIIGDVLNIEMPANAEYGRSGVSPRKEGTIGFHSLRGGDIPSSHTVYFAGLGERLEITHHTTNWQCFADGACDAALFIYNKPPNMYSVQDALGL